MMKFHTIKVQTIDSGQNLTVSSHARRQSFFTKHAGSHAKISTLARNLFKILTHQDQELSKDEQNMNYVSSQNESDLRSLEQLENCANAARKTEAYSEYE